MIYLIFGSDIFWGKKAMHFGLFFFLTQKAPTWFLSLFGEGRIPQNKPDVGGQGMKKFPC